jgi:hypothetical protein
MPPTSALLQLVARGRQDAYLTSNPQFTFFKHVYRRYTPFAMESIPIDFDGDTDFGRRITVVIPRYAELLTSLVVEVDLPPLPQPDPANPTIYWVNDTGAALITDVSIEIGEKEIDKHTGEWLNIWGELTVPKNKRDGYDEMMGHWNVYPPSAIDATQPLQLIIPLRFWFCNTIGAALPLVALQAHPVRIIMHLRPFQEMWWSAALPAPPGQPCPSINPVSITRFQMFGDYIYLDTEERRRFAAAEHEYLIDQLQISPIQSVPVGVGKINMPLYFNHCCKEFVWVVQETRMAAAREWFNYSSALQNNGGEPGVITQDLMATALLRLDGNDRFYIRNAPYFRLTQPYQHHTNIPTAPVYIYLYSFSMNPEEEQPSGSLNCSKIDDINMAIAFNAAELTQDRSVQIYATNYNVLRIIGGLGGLAFIA